MKIVSSGRVINSREFYEKKKKRRRVKFVFFSIGFILILVSFVYLSRQEKFLITEVRVLGENIVDKEELAQVVRRELAGYYFLVVPRTNTFLYPRRLIKQSLVEEFPRLKSVDFDLSGLRELLITIEEHVPFALYCNPECFFLDEDGFIFAPAPSFSAGVYFIYTTSNPVLSPIGKRFITTEEFKSLSKFIADLAPLDIQPSTLETGEDNYILGLAEGGQIIWQREGNLALIHSNLEAFLSDEAIRAQGDFLDRIRYLDLRTENKVFYKFK